MAVIEDSCNRCPWWLPLATREKLGLVPPGRANIQYPFPLDVDTNEIKIRKMHIYGIKMEVPKME